MDTTISVRRSPIAALVIAFGLVAAVILGGSAGYLLKSMGTSSKASAVTPAAVTIVVQPNSSRAQQQEARRLFLLRGPRSYDGDDPIVVSRGASGAQAQPPAATHTRLKSLGE